VLLPNLKAISEIGNCPTEKTFAAPQASPGAEKRAMRCFRKMTSGYVLSITGAAPQIGDDSSGMG
jgi:hypothetical protein